jgi:hypothetical protein
MSDSRRMIILLVAWGIGACLCLASAGGSIGSWAFGLGLAFAGWATFAAAFLPDTGPRDKQRFIIGGGIFGLVGLFVLFMELRGQLGF